jgi:glycosyltransferase involved in cell wall biosynthesis
MKEYCGLDSTPLYHPPWEAEKFYCDEPDDYLFYPSRIAPVKRQGLVVEALARTRQPVRLCFAGAADQPRFLHEVQTLARTLEVFDRIDWRGQVSEDEKRKLYARSIAVIYPPRDEDFGYVTLEAMLASKPVLTCSDSGGPLEFVQPRRTGLIAEPTPEGLALAMDELWQERSQARQWGRAGRAHYQNLKITWPHVIRSLLSCA